MTLDDLMPEPKCKLTDLVTDHGRHVCKSHRDCEYKIEGKGGVCYCQYLEQLRNVTQLKCVELSYFPQFYTKKTRG